MIEYITWLRAFAAMLITNSHFGAVHPSPSMAAGGLLGNLLFFSVSGFCLVNLKRSFFPWYCRRLIRIYPSVWITSLICLGCGLYSVSSWEQAIKLFIYPTYYHFIASIIILYIPFYAIAKWSGAGKSPQARLLWAIVTVGLLYVLVYTLAYDYSYYHIDTVEEPMIRFPYFLAMLGGAWFRYHQDTGSARYMRLAYLLLLVTLPTYFISKHSFSTGALHAEYQILNQLTILLLTANILWCGSLSNRVLETAPSRLRRAVAFISRLTLEIYLVQYLILAHANIGVYPLNALLVTGCIILAAYIVQQISYRIQKSLDRSLT